MNKLILAVSIVILIASSFIFNSNIKIENKLQAFAEQTAFMRGGILGGWRVPDTVHIIDSIPFIRVDTIHVYHYDTVHIFLDDTIMLDTTLFFWQETLDTPQTNILWKAF